MYSYSGIQLTEHTLSLRCSFASELLKSLAQQERLLVRDHWTRPFLIPINPEVFCSGSYKGNLNILILVQDLNKFMSKRVYLVGHELTLADIMLYYALHPVMLELTVHGKEQLINLSRWFNQVLFHPQRPRGSQSGREKRCDKSFQLRAKEPLGTDSHRTISKIQADAASWLGTKSALYYCAQSANGFSWVLFVSSYTTAIVTPHLPCSFTKLVRARKTYNFNFPNQKRSNYRRVEKTFGMLSAEAIQFAPRISCFWQITCIVNNRKFKMRRRRESQISNSFTRQNNNFACASCFLVHFFAVNCTTTHENA